ncbi:sortase, partial [Streptococcus canis]
MPRINQKIPIYAGTSDEVLQKGAGLLEGTSLPVGGKSTHTVI